jgi:ATP-binding cassette subfamily B (MDR/TAP) protein 1
MKSITTHISEFNKKFTSIDRPNQASSPATANKTIRFRKFFTYITPFEKLLLVIGTFGAIVAGGIYPALAIVSGKLVNTFSPTNYGDDILDKMYTLMVAILIIGLISWVFAYVFYSFWQHLSERITFDLRKQFLDKLLKQDIAFFETQDIESLPSMIGEYFTTISGAIGEKFSNILNAFSSFIIAFIMVLIQGPLFAVICISFFPIIFTIIFIFAGKLKSASQEKLAVSRQLCGHVEENITAIKLIVSFAKEKLAIEGFQHYSNLLRAVTYKREITISFLAALVRTLTFLYYAYSFWIGAMFVKSKRFNERTQSEYDAGDVITV